MRADELLTPRVRVGCEGTACCGQGKELPGAGNVLVEGRALSTTGTAEEGNDLTRKDNMDTVTTEIPTIPGMPFAGGFFAGLINQADGIYAIIVAPKSEGEHPDAPWGKAKRIADALSFFDGLANTEAMAAAGNKLAAWARGLRIGDFDDWHIPARDELELAYRNLKPTVDANYCWRGDNPSSVPPGYAYMTDSPAQTKSEIFREGGTEAFRSAWYWTSTQSAGLVDYAWAQLFTNGGQNDNRKDGKYRARAVRRVKVQ